MPAVDANFITELKTTTEAKWAADNFINPAVYGFQFQQGTKWNPGLTVAEIDEYENVVSAKFPTDYRIMLQLVNGTDRPNLNLYGRSSDPYRTAFTLYAFPRDLAIVRERISVIEDNRDEIANALCHYEQYSLSSDAVLLPIYGHRYLVCDGGDRSLSRVLSIVGADVVTYGMDLQGYLTREFLS